MPTAGLEVGRFVTPVPPIVGLLFVLVNAYTEPLALMSDPPVAVIFPANTAELLVMVTVAVVVVETVGADNTKGVTPVRAIVPN